MRPRAFLAVAALSVVAASCSSGTASTSGTSTTTATSPANGGHAPPARSADKALSEQAVLKLSDFPTGWTSQPSNNSNSSPNGLDQRMATCLHTTVGLLNSNNPTESDSPDFSDSNDSTASNQVDYESSPAAVDQVIAVFKEPQAASCLQSALNAYISYSIQHPSNPSDSVPKNVTFGHATVALMQFPAVGDQTIAYRISLPITASTVTLAVYVDIVIFVKGRAGVAMTFEAIGDPFDASMEQQLTTLTEGRLSST